jgi:small subunit ribosomal protein S20
MKNVIKGVDEAIASNSVEVISERLLEAVSVIDKTAQKGVIHRNRASRQVSRLSHRVNAFLAAQQS